MQIEHLDSEDYGSFYALIAQDPSAFMLTWMKTVWNTDQYGYPPVRSIWDRGYSVVQFWDSGTPPDDVAMLIEEWKAMVPEGCHELFDDVRAKSFVMDNFGALFVEAFDYCYHPAVRADYFRLAYLLIKGGFYADADLKPYGELPCFDFSAHSFMCSGLLTREKERDPDRGWIWLTADEANSRPIDGKHPTAYMNNEIIASEPNNPIIRIAFMRATRNLLYLKRIGKTGSPHTFTGPSVITQAATVHLLSAAIKQMPYSRLYLSSYGRINPTFTVATVNCEYKADHRGWMIEGKRKGFDLQ